jgi:hypothetical protein
MIKGTEFVVMLPKSIQQALAGDGGFGCCEAPVGLPGFCLDMQWHQGMEKDGANAWLREQIDLACDRQSK